MVYEMYEPLPHGRKRLVSTFDSATETVTMVEHASVVTMQAATQPARLRTSQAPAPRVQPTRPRGLWLMDSATGQEIRPTPPEPPVDTLALIVQRRRELGLMA